MAVARRNELLTAFLDNLDDGLIKFYSGTRPAGPDTALSGNTLLATATFGATAFGSPSGGAATANAITGDAAADASGIPTFARLFEDDGTTVVADVSVGKTGSGAELIINTEDGSGNAYITIGVPVDVASLTMTFGLGT
jgi:hypothetical protein